MKLLVSKRVGDPPKKHFNLYGRNKLSGNDRAQLLKETPELLKHDGIKLIKRIELGTKWRDFVDKEYVNDPIYAVPTELEMAQFKGEKKRKRDEKLSLLQRGKRIATGAEKLPEGSTAEVVPYQVEPSE